jgi:hypothetical protein
MIEMSFIKHGPLMEVVFCDKMLLCLLVDYKN